jgi:hypothetical protein
MPALTGVDRSTKGFAPGIHIAFETSGDQQERTEAGAGLDDSG